MLSLKRLLYIVLIVAVLGGIFLIYSININESLPASVQIPDRIDSEREFTETRRVAGGDKPRVWIFGDSDDVDYGEIYDNVRQFCRDLHLTVAGEGSLDTSVVKEQDLVIICDASISQYADLSELKRFISEGGRVILAAGLAKGGEDSRLWSVFGIQEKSAGEDYHDLYFEKPLLPVQPEQVCYDGNSGSVRIEVSDDVTVYIRDAQKGIPILYTNDWKKGSVCLINGSFLKDIRCMGLLSGAIGALLPDFVYPVLGVKAVFLDDFPVITSADDELCRQMYGYSAEGFVQDVVWPSFQGIALRTDTPYTASILAAASSKKSFGTMDDTLVTTVGKSVLQFGGELVYAANCPEDGKVVFNEDFIDRFAKNFTGYTVQGLAVETDNFFPEMLDVPGADVRFVRGILGNRDMRLSWEEGRTVFPAATKGNSMEDGNLFAICSVLGAYGMVSHVFDAGMLISRDSDIASWDSDKRQIGIFESEVLVCVPWLEGRTLSQTEGDVRSYQDMDYGWIKNGSSIEINCSSVSKGQAFFYHTDGRIVEAKGLTYQDVGNGYYLLRIQENHGIIILEEGK